MKKVDWNKWRYRMGREMRECLHCGWSRRAAGSDAGHGPGRCGQCGGELTPVMVFGGLRVVYNRHKDNFTLETPGQGMLASVYVDNADVPDTIAFMNKHFRLEGWGVDEDVWLREGREGK
jgi:hypothetical protein